MNLTESEKRLAYQIELTDQIGTLHELAMMNRYTKKSERECGQKMGFNRRGNLFFHRRKNLLLKPLI